jgi:hypothetical protein
VTKEVVCNPRKNALLKAGNKGDQIDARKLAELLRGGLLSAVYHGETGLRTLKLGRSYLALSKDLTRTMNRIKALYRRVEHSLRWRVGVCAAASSGMVEQDHRTRRSSACRVVLSAETSISMR